MHIMYLFIILLKVYYLGLFTNGIVQRNNF